MTTSDPPWRQSKPSPGPVIDMTIKGEFTDTSQPGIPPIPARVMGVALLVAIVAGAVAIALLALWLALTLIPIAIAAGVIAYGVFRMQLWSARRQSLGGKRDLSRP
jgi:high-affinity Fe2+/Pb2+ permease